MESKGSKAHQSHLISLGSETDFEGWRKAARALVLSGANPSEVTWTVRGHEGASSGPSVDASLEVSRGTFSVPAKFVELARAAILHRDAERFAILYRLLWRLRSHHDLLDDATDPDVSQMAAMAKAVHRDQHRMQAAVRFREVGRERESHYLAWFEPEHHIVELAAPFFAGRFADMPWSILTPDRLRALGRPCRLDHARYRQARNISRRPPGGNLAAPLRRDLQSGTAEHQGHAERGAG